jgi:glycosyltransferase involved in cell wall biosynthesis
MSRCRVLVFTETALALSETFIAAHCRELQRYDYTLVSLANSGDHHPDIERHLLFPRRPNPAQRLAFRLGLSRQMDKLIEQTRPDIIHAHYLTNGAFMVPYAQRHEIPLIATVHGHDATRALRPLSVYDQIYRLRHGQLRRKAAMVLPVSDFLHHKLLQAGFPPERTLTHYLGIKLPECAPVDSAANPQRIVFVGRLVSKKGIDKVLEAFDLVRAANPGAELHIVGDGPLRDVVIAKAGTSAGIICHGAQPPERTQQIISKARLLTLPSRQADDGDVEGLGLVLLEAQALGIPVVTSNNSGTAEALLDGETGFAVDPASSKDLAQAFLRLLNSAELARSMGMNAARFVRENFDITARTPMLERIYDQAIENHATRKVPA